MYHAEDQIDRVVREAFFADLHDGVLVEVGAAGPEYLSIAKHFRDDGWRVLAVEPNPDFCAMHREVGLQILEYACGDRDEDDVDFEVVLEPAPYQGGQITYESFSALRVSDAYRERRPTIQIHKTIKVKLRRLDTILRVHAPEIRRIDLLTVDVEGWEIAVLEGLSLDHYEPRVLIIENLINDSRYRDYMRERGYTLYLQMRPNEIYVRDVSARPRQGP